MYLNMVVEYVAGSRATITLLQAAKYCWGSEC